MLGTLFVCVLNNDCHCEKYDNYLDEDGKDDHEIFNKFPVDQDMPSLQFLPSDEGKQSI